MGIPGEIVVVLARLGNSTVFVETGTFHGATARWASNHFESVHAIEKAEGLHKLHRDEIVQTRGVTPHLGDSRVILPEIVKTIGSANAVFWLDGHWSGGDTAGATDECPVLGELSCLAGRTGDIILVDDARLFLCAPPPPHNPAHWPTILDIAMVLSKFKSQSFVQIVDDVIFIVPNVPNMRTMLVEYARGRSNNFWQGYLLAQQEKIGRPAV